MRGFKKSEKPKTIVTAGYEKVFASVWGYITDQARQRVPVRISDMNMPGLGRNLFSSVKAINLGVSTILETGTPTYISTATLCVR